MKLACAALLATFLGLPGAARAQGEPDPRWMYTAELGLGGEGVGEFSTPRFIAPFKLASTERAISYGAFLGRALFFGPIRENLQAGGGVVIDGQGFARGVGGVRVVTGTGALQTKLDVQGTVGLVTAIMVGVRVSVGVAWEVARGWRVGADAGASVLLGHFSASIEATGTVGYSF